MIGLSVIQIFYKLALLKPSIDVLIVECYWKIGTISVLLAKQQGIHVTVVLESKEVELTERLGSGLIDIDYLNNNYKNLKIL